MRIRIIAIATAALLAVGCEEEGLDYFQARITGAWNSNVSGPARGQPQGGFPEWILFAGDDESVQLTGHWFNEDDQRPPFEGDGAYLVEIGIYGTGYAALENPTPTGLIVTQVSDKRILGRINVTAVSASSDTIRVTGSFDVKRRVAQPR